MQPYVALFLDHFDGGGVEMVIANLAQGLIDQGLKVDLVLCRKWGRFLDKVPHEVRIIDLQAPRMLLSIFALTRYLKQEQPKALLSAQHYTNEVALLAKQLAGTSTRVIVSEHNILSKYAADAKRFTVRMTPWAARCFYPQADGIVAVSRGVAADLSHITKLSCERIQVIYNPAITPDLLQKSQEPIEHPWFKPGEPPVILSVGRLSQEKDFSTLIQAFAQIRQVQPARLIILGHGGKQPLLDLIHQLNLEDQVDLPGYVSNPYAYMSRAAVFALSSRWESFGLVLAEALAVGTSVVSTDCECGPREILDHGKYGFLVPVGDSCALAKAILNTLSAPLQKVNESDWLKQFSLETVTQQYLKVLKGC
jgi:glycosyltransferase involved in cell wall biosynthesis